MTGSRFNANATKKLFISVIIAAKRLFVRFAAMSVTYYFRRAKNPLIVKAF